MLNQEIQNLIEQLPPDLQRQVLELMERAATSDKPADLVRELEFLLGVEVSESSFGAWQDTETSFLGRT